MRQLRIKTISTTTATQNEIKSAIRSVNVMIPMIEDMDKRVKYIQKFLGMSDDEIFAPPVIEEVVEVAEAPKPRKRGRPRTKPLLTKSTNSDGE